MKVGVLALILLVNVARVQIDAAELLEDVPEVTRWKLRVIRMMKDGFMTTVLTDIAPCFDPPARDRRVRQGGSCAIRKVTFRSD